MAVHATRWLYFGFLAVCLIGGLLIISLNADRVIFMVCNAALAAGVSDTVLSHLTLLGQAQCVLALLTPTLWRAPRVAAALVYATPIGLLLTHGPKYLLAVDRPSATLPADSFHQVGTVLSTYALPSGHSLTAFSVASVAVLASTARPQRGRARWALAALLMAMAVAASRIGVGAHWPSDVLIGAALGGVTGTLAWLAANRWPVLESRQGRLAVIIVACLSLLALWSMALGYPLALDFQRALATFGLACTALAFWLWTTQGPSSVAPARGSR